MVLRVEKKLFVIEQSISPAPPAVTKYLRSGMRLMMLIMRRRENQLAHMSCWDSRFDESKKLDDSTAGDDTVVPKTNEKITLAQTLIQIV
ncbi:hypothetical protein Tco_0161593 [Tanacetum coccineum]